MSVKNVGCEQAYWVELWHNLVAEPVHTYIHDFVLSRIYRVAKKLISSRQEKERKIYK